MVKLLYLASLRERMGRGEEQISVPDRVVTVQDLMTWLLNRDAAGAAAFAQPAVVRASVNQEFAQPGTKIGDGDEIAFFPPVTGG